MLTITYYFLQVILCSGIMMGYYWLVLRNKRFHQYNRFYLLAIALFSWMVPLIKIKWGRTPVSDDLQMFQFLSLVADNNTQMEESLIHKGFHWNVELLVSGLYIAFGCILLFGMIKALYRIYRLLQMNACKNVGDVYLIMTQAKGTPFSFFRYIFWNEEIDIKTEAGKQILQHELTHVQQKHSYDKVFIQLVLIMGWFNPFFWLLRKEMDMIHEFIADKKAVNNGDTASLAQMLLTTVYPQQQFALTHPFFFSPIKRRLQMLAQNKNPRYSYVRRLVVLPLLAMVVVLFAFRNKESNTTLSVASVMATVVDQQKLANSIEKVNLYMNRSGEFSQEDHLSDIKTLLHNLDTVIIKSEPVIINDKAGVLKVTMPPNTNANKPLIIVDGKKADNQEVNAIDPSLIQTVNVLKDNSSIALYGDEGKNGVILITTKLSNLSKPVTIGEVPFDQSLDSKKQGALSFIQSENESIQNNLNGSSKIVNVTGYKKFPDTLIYLKDKNGNKLAQQPLVIIDGVKGDMNSVTPNEIASINVWKGDSAIKKYGEDGKNGVVEINTKKIVKVQGYLMSKNASSGSEGTVMDLNFEKSENPLSVSVQNSEEFNSFMKRNSDVKQVYWIHSPSKLKVQLKDGTEEIYDLTNRESKKRAENKYGALPSAPPQAPVTTSPSSSQLGIEKYASNEEFLKRNPSIQYVDWSKAPVKIVIKLKDGTIENYDLTNPESRKKAQYKYGSIQIAPPPPPPGPTTKQTQQVTQNQIQAEFPGGEAAWFKYLERNLNKDIVKTNGGPPGKYTVVVSFIIDKLGNLSEIEAINDPGYGTKEEAIRMIVKGPRWTPAILNGKPVIFRQKQSITFNVTDSSAKIGFKNTKLPTSVPPPIVEENYDKVFTKVQIPAKFPGGQAAWLKYLQQNLNRDLPVEKGAPPGKYTDSLTFIVDKKGTISKVKSLNDPGFGTKEESLRVFTMMPKWKPALQNGRPVTSLHFKTITFVITEE